LAIGTLQRRWKQDFAALARGPEGLAIDLSRPCAAAWVIINPFDAGSSKRRAGSDKAKAHKHMRFIIEILGNQGVLARKILTHVNTPKGARVEAEWLMATYAQIGAVAARIINHQGEEIFMVSRQRMPLRGNRSPARSSWALLRARRKPAAARAAAGLARLSPAQAHTRPRHAVQRAIWRQ
jgi:hypothetical protein